MDRAEHLEWSKERALAYLPEDVPGATASFVSDLSKHEELRGHVVMNLIAMHAFAGLLDEAKCRDLIVGAN